MKISDLMEEITGFTKIGDFSKDTIGKLQMKYATIQHHGFVWADAKLINAANYEIKLKSFLSDTHHPFNFIFVQPKNKQQSNNFVFAGHFNIPIAIDKFKKTYNGVKLSQQEISANVDKLLAQYKQKIMQLIYLGMI